MASIAIAQQLFQCHYCNDRFELHKALHVWEVIDETDDGDVLNQIASYCGPYCVEKSKTAQTTAGTTRG